MIAKIFGIGLNKTGTKTLGYCFHLLGFNHLSCRPDLLVDFRSGNIFNVFSEIDQHETFEDWPYPLMYQELFFRYGDRAKFVLTLRRDSQTWLESLKRHSERVDPDRHCRLLAYGYAYPHGREARHIEIYERHIFEVRRFFQRHRAEDRLIDLCWEDGAGWSELCGFLDLPIPPVPFPHENRAPDSVDPTVLQRNRAQIRQQLGLLNLVPGGVAGEACSSEAASSLGKEIKTHS